MNPLRFAPLALVLLVTPASAHGGILHDGCPAGETFTAGPIAVSGAFARAMLPAARVGAGYLSIANAGNAADRLLSVTTEAAPAAELHNMSVKDGMMTMTPIEGGIEVPAGGSVALEPGGMHIMFIGPSEPFREGECVEVTLHFERAGDLPVTIGVGGVGAGEAPMAMHHAM